jgi:hypothetical protein
MQKIKSHLIRFVFVFHQTFVLVTFLQINFTNKAVERKRKIALKNSKQKGMFISTLTLRFHYES